MNTAKQLASESRDVVANDVVTPHPDVRVGRRVTLKTSGVVMTGTLGCESGLWFLYDVRGFRAPFTRILVTVGCEAEIAKYAVAWDPCVDCGSAGDADCDPTCRAHAWGSR